MAGRGSFPFIGIDLTAGRLPSIDVKLEVGGVAETVEVSSTAPLVDLTQSKVATTVEREALLCSKPCRRIIPIAVRRIGRSIESLRPGLRGTLVGAERGLELTAPLGAMALHGPEFRQRSGQPQHMLGLARRLQPGESGTEVVVLALQPLEPLLGARAEQVRLGLFRERKEVLRVTPPKLLGLA